MKLLKKCLLFAAYFSDVFIQTDLGWICLTRFFTQVFIRFCETGIMSAHFTWEWCHFKLTERKNLNCLFNYIYFVQNVQKLRTRQNYALHHKIWISDFTFTKLWCVLSLNLHTLTSQFLDNKKVLTRTFFRTKRE